MLILLTGIGLSGCRKLVEQGNVAAGPQSDGMSAQEILAGVQNAYALAPAYADEGYLYLSYRLQGSLIQEQQPWKTKFQRPNHLAGDWFNSRIRCDGTRLGCYVFDNDTANLDNQWLVLDATAKIPVAQLLADPMARHFVAGDSEIPLDSTVPGGQMPLIPAVVGLLTGEQAWPVLKVPEIAVRMDDATVDERACYHLQLSCQRISVECWIDMESFLVRQMTLPVELLDETVRSSQEISELRFFARMHGCGFSEAASPETLAAFEVTAPGGAKAVRHLITLPEEFPCEYVGKPSPELTFQSADGTRMVPFPEGDKTQVLIWLPGMIDPGTSEGIAATISESIDADIRYVLNGEHLQPVPDKRIMYPWVAQCLAQLKDRNHILVDPKLDCLQKARMKNAASAIVFDREKVVQYAVNLSDNEWQQKLAAAISRINARENIGREMQADYSQYLETYHRRLQMVAVGDTTGSSGPAAEIAGTFPMQAQQVWSCNELQKPGNLLVAEDGTLVAVDGWRSIVRIGPDGKAGEAQKLDIPKGSSISRLRQVNLDGKTVWAAFSTLGQGVFLFFDGWQPITSISGDGQNLDRVLDCRFGRNATGEPVICVAFESTGVRQFKMDGTADGTISDQRFEAIGCLGDRVMGLKDGKVVNVQDLTELVGNQIATSFLPVSPGKSSGTKGAVAISVGMNTAQIWTALILHDETRMGMEGLAGPQLFDTQIEPLVRLQSRGLTCVADSNGQVRVFDDGLRILCRFHVPGINGLAIGESNGAVMVYCSSTKQVVAWRLEDRASTPSGERME